MAASDVLTQILDAQVARSVDQIHTDLQGEVVLLNAKSGKYYNLNAVGSFIWKRIEQPGSVRSIVDAVMNEYNVERGRCEQDVAALLTALRGAGLVEITFPAVLE